MTKPNPAAAKPPDPNRQPVPMWVICENPTDYPGKFVAREWRVLDGVVSVCIEPIAVVDTLDAARKAIVGNRRDLLNMGRNPTDEPQIVEVWL